MEDIRELFKIYFIESPSEEDIKNKINEGEAILGGLKLARINYKLFTPNSKEELNYAIEEIIKDVLSIRGEIGGITLHFSMHGNQSGLGLTNGEIVLWNELVVILEKLIEGIERIPDQSGYLKQDIAPINLIFSSCFGSYASEILKISQDQLFIGLVGPNKDIAWEDAQIGYSLLYYNTIIKKIGFKDTVELMNKIVGEDSFSLYPGHGFIAV